MSCKPYCHHATTFSDRELIDDKGWRDANRLTVLTTFEESNGLQFDVGKGCISGHNHNELGIFGALKSYWEQQIAKQEPMSHVLLNDHK